MKKNVEGNRFNSSKSRSGVPKKYFEKQARGPLVPKPFQLPKGLYYETSFLSDKDKRQLTHWLGSLRPLWEKRYTDPVDGKDRKLLRPVYWLGNWQFASLNYYHPPKGVLFRCLKAEAYPSLLATIVRRIERRTKDIFLPNDIPKGWHLNTCLINFYGSLKEGEKKTDLARVGEHKDFEPGPVASFSMGERAFFQFVDSQRQHHRTGVVFQQWLEDNSLQIFGGKKWKEDFFHRVQRVEKNKKELFSFKIPDFETRRVNFTFRYVPDHHVHNWDQFPRKLQQQIYPYIKELSESSSFFKGIVNRASKAGF